ncbi:MAG: hypothetical protein AAFY10_00245 [Pseudomonadota bacterium]
MMRWVLPALVLFLANPAGPAVAEEPCIADREKLLALDIWTFDQDPGLGWRSISVKEGCDAAAADLIAEYHERLRAKGEPVFIQHPEVGKFEFDDDGTVPLLYWHEGQVRAGLGDTQAARELFVLNLETRDSNSFGWNHYALATIAFLDGDMEKLKSERDLLAAADQNGINTAAIDALIRCFDRPYLEAYGSAECRTPRWAD